MIYAIKRLVVLAITLIVVSFVVFLIPFVSPGDPASKILRSRVSDLAQDPAALEALRQKYGLDDPIVVQYWGWLHRALTGDLGISYTSGTTVTPQIGHALVVTTTLAVTALIFAFVVSVPLGSLAAVRRGGRADAAITVVSQGFVAIPEYWIAPVAVFAFSVHLGIFPSAGWSGPRSMVLPCLVLALRPISYFTQVAKASMIDVLEAPHITAARSRGLSFSQALVRHGLRNGLLPVMTLFSVWLAGLIGGSVVIEVIFSIPGMGRLLYESVLNSDMPMAQAGLICIVALAVAIATLTDLAYAWVNPTVRTAKSHG